MNRLVTLIALSALALIGALATPNHAAHADEPSPRSSQALLMLYPAWARKNVCASNAYAIANPLAGKIVRYQTPVAINPHGVPQVWEAMRNFEALTSGAVTFRVVDTDPVIGIVVVTGDALNREGQPGCGHVSAQRVTPATLQLSVNRDGVIQSRLYVHLGSSHCDHVREGFQPQALSEHELAHALGLLTHFTGFTGIEGITLEMLVTLTAVYRLPPGTDVSALCARE